MLRRMMRTLRVKGSGTWAVLPAILVERPLEIAPESGAGRYHSASGNTPHDHGGVTRDDQLHPSGMLSVRPVEEYAEPTSCLRHYEASWTRPSASKG